MGHEERISVRVVLVSTDIEIIETFCRMAQAMAIHVDTCCDVESAMRKLCHGKFEGIVVDLESKGGADLLKKIRSLTSNKSALTFAIRQSKCDSRERFFTSANFVVERPVQPAIIFHALKASYSMMVREKRRYFRCPVQISVYVTRGSNPEFVVPSLNLSEAGICLSSSTPMEVGDQLRLRLRLPGDSEFLTLNGEVCWSEAMGRVGIQFSGLTSKANEALQNWLGERLEETLSTLELSARGRS
jgi:hypothetical protein